MDKLAAKRAKQVRISTEEVLLELEEEGEPITAGSNDKFDDLICEEKQRDKWEGDGMFSDDNTPSTSHASAYVTVCLNSCDQSDSEV